MNLHTIRDYKWLYDFITKTMNAKTNYQPIMIRTILEEGVVLKEMIDQKIRLENPDKQNDFVSREVYEVLVDKHKIVKLDVNGYKLDLHHPLTMTERYKLIDLCNQEISRIKEIQELLEKGVSKTHVDIIKKFYNKRGKYLQASELYGRNKINL